MKILIDPVDQERGGVLDQLERSGDAESSLQQGERLDEHIVVRRSARPAGAPLTEGEWRVTRDVRETRHATGGAWPTRLAGGRAACDE